MCENWPLSPEPRRPWLTVFVPAYNERAGLAQSVWRVLAVLDRFGVAAKVLIVDDASRDYMAAVVAAMAELDPRIRCISHPVNLGLGSGLTTAIAQARGDWLILVPADLAIDPVDLRRYFELSSNADVVVGVADVHVDYSWFRRLVHAANIRVVQVLFGMRERQFQYICLYRLAMLRLLQIEYIRSLRPSMPSADQGESDRRAPGRGRRPLRAASDGQGGRGAQQPDPAHPARHDGLLAARRRHGRPSSGGSCATHDGVTGACASLASDDVSRHDTIPTRGSPGVLIEHRHLRSCSDDVSRHAACLPATFALTQPSERLC